MADKFLPPLIDFIHSNFSQENNTFYLYGDESKYSFLRDRGVFFLGKKDTNISYFQLLLEMYKADKIILHGLFSSKVIKILFYNPWLLKRCYWLMWGGDLYETKKKSGSTSYYKKTVIKNMGHLLTYLPGDVEYARAKFGAKGRYVEMIGYLSNVIPSKTLVSENNKKNNINILVGNSADPSNNHFDALDKIAKFKNENIKIYAPLSYGDKDYAKEVINYGVSIFGNKFIAISEFMSYDKYVQFLNEINIAVFNHQRQQAMGNTINLLAMGKMVYLKEGTTQKEFFNNLNVKTFDIKDLDIFENFSPEKNSEILMAYFSLQNLKNQWAKIL